jgi:cytoskeletal protein RodZ
MSSKIILPIVLVILVLLVGVGIYAAFANLNPLKDNKAAVNTVSSVSRRPNPPAPSRQPTKPKSTPVNPYVEQSSTASLVSSQN